MVTAIKSLERTNSLANDLALYEYECAKYVTFYRQFVVLQFRSVVLVMKFFGLRAYE